MKYMLILLFCLLATPAAAVQPDEMLRDPLLEARAREISRNLRCMVCQGEDIDESNADLAGDLRKLVRARLVAGDSDAEVTQFVQARYGDQVLLRPPLAARTLPLWIAPFVVLLAGFWLVRRARGKGGA